LHVGRQAGLALTENHVVMTVGAGGGLNVVLKTILNPGDEVIPTRPISSSTVSSRQPSGQPGGGQDPTRFSARHRAIAGDHASDPRRPDQLPQQPHGWSILARSAGPREILRQKRGIRSTIYLISTALRALVYDGVRVRDPRHLRARHPVTSHSKDLALL